MLTLTVSDGLFTSHLWTTQVQGGYIGDTWDHAPEKRASGDCVWGGGGVSSLTFRPHVYTGQRRSGVKAWVLLSNI
jgi:hypothetical protein